eukprot:6206548-Pleurochrysis_carterae.AAC.7
MLVFRSAAPAATGIGHGETSATSVPCPLVDAVSDQGAVRRACIGPRLCLQPCGRPHTSACAGVGRRLE